MLQRKANFYYISSPYTFKWWSALYMYFHFVKCTYSQIICAAQVSMIISLYPSVHDLCSELKGQVCVSHFLSLQMFWSDLCRSLVQAF